MENLVRNYDAYIKSLKEEDKLFETPALVALGNYLECTIIVLTDFCTRPYSIKHTNTDKCFILAIIGGKLLFPFLTKPELHNIIRDEFRIDHFMNDDDNLSFSVNNNDDEDDENFDL